MSKFRRFTRRGATTLRRNRQRQVSNLVALPETTGTQTGFQKMDSTATSAQKATQGTGGTTIKVGKTSSVQYSWEPDYLDKYEAVFPMDKNLLFRTLSVQTDSRKTKRMEGFIVKFVERLAAAGMDIRYTHTTSGNIYVTKGAGPIYPTIVAHTDTVHDIVPNDEYEVRSNGKIMWAHNPKLGTWTGIGGDDKVGVFIALSMLRDLPTAKAAFFVDEEIGCIGSSLAAMEFFVDRAFVLQCDRRGNDDFVDRIFGTDLYGPEFATAIKDTLARFGYTPTTGGLTDVVTLKEQGLDVACANMSCGYFSPHSRWETVGLLDVQRCYDLVQTLCENFGAVRWEHVAEEPAWKKRVGHYTSKGITYEYDLDSPYRPWNDGGTGWANGMDRTRTGGGKALIWQDGTLVPLGSQPFEDKTDRSLKSIVRRLHEQGWEDPDLVTDLATLEADLQKARQVEQISTVSVSQLLEEDRAIIESANMDWPGSTRTRFPDYAECPDCKSNSLVTFDDEDEQYWCYGCNRPFTSGHNPWTDDETRFPDAGEDAGYAYGG